jgi:hypothetical protein
LISQSAGLTGRRSIHRAAGAVAKIRAAGYPTPAWLAVGITTSGFGYQIQGFVPGRSPNRVTVREARPLIEVLETHAGLEALGSGTRVFDYATLLTADETFNRVSRT